MALTGSLGNLTGSLTMESAAFIRDLGKAAGAVASSTAGMQRSFNNLQRTATAAFAGFIGIQGVRALANISRAAIDTGDEIGEAASKLGIGAEALQRLRFAASQTDVDVTALNVAMKQFQKNLALGVITASTGDISGAFEEWITKIREAPTQLDKVAIAVKAFAKQYQTALLIAAQGGTFTDALKGAFVISQKGIDIASELDNKIRAIQNSVQAGFNTGFLEAFVGKVAVTDKELTDLNTTMRTLGGIVGGIVSDVAGFIKDINAFVQRHPGFFSDKFNLPPATLTPETRVQMGKGTVVGEGVLNLPPALAKATGAGGRSGAGGVNLPQTLNESTAAFHANQDAIDGWTTSVTDALGRSLDFEDMQKEGIHLFASLQTPMEQYASSIERISALQASGAIDAETFARAHQQLTLGMVSNWTGAAGAVSGALATIFKDNKAFAIANVVINTADAIVSALKNPPGPPFSYVYAAAAAATGAAQLATILSAQPGTGGKSVALKSGKATATAAGTTAGTARGIGSSQTVTLNIIGDVFGPEHFRKIVAGINGVQRDGTALLQVA